MKLVYFPSCGCVDDVVNNQLLFANCAVPFNFHMLVRT